MASARPGDTQIGNAIQDYQGEITSAGEQLSPGSEVALAANESRRWPNRLRDFLYRAADITVATVGLVGTLPIALVVGYIIKRDSHGPAVFRQVRVKKNGERFAFYKFRTLYSDARVRWPELYSYKYTAYEIRNLHFKTANDPRITPVGRWLRRTTLDEIPNLINLLRGDVTMVGPRPEIPEMLRYYTPEELLKFTVKPGLTGLAQTNGRNQITFKETIAWDIEYVRTRSLGLDLRILYETVKRVISRDGAL